MDTQTINSVAAAAVGFLVPYLTGAGEAAAKKIGEDIYQAIKTRFGKKPTAQETLADLKQTPEDRDKQAALRVQLKKVLAEDETLAKQLLRLLKEADKTEEGSTIIRLSAGDNATQFGQVFGDVTIGKE